MKKFSNPFFHSCEKRGRSIGEGRDFRGGGTLSIVARRDNGRAVLRETPTLARRAHGRAAHTYGTEALSVSTEEVGRAHAHNGGERERGRGAARRVVSGIEISGFGNSRCKRLYDRPPPPRTIGLNSAN